VALAFDDVNSDQEQLVARPVQETPSPPQTSTQARSSALEGFGTSLSIVAVSATATAAPPATNTPAPSPSPTATEPPPTAEPVFEAAIVEEPTEVILPPTNTPIPPTDTPVPPTETPVPPTPTEVPPTEVPPTATPVPPTPTLEPTATATRVTPTSVPALAPTRPAATATSTRTPSTGPNPSDGTSGLVSGHATRYADSLEGNTMACGGVFDQTNPYIIAVSLGYDTAWPCGTSLEVCGSAGCITGVRTDTCPGCPGADIDLSRAGLDAVCGNQEGCTVVIRVLS
jgi:hypothetical protein